MWDRLLKSSIDLLARSRRSGGRRRRCGTDFSSRALLSWLAPDVVRERYGDNWAACPACGPWHGSAYRPQFTTPSPQSRAARAAPRARRHTVRQGCSPLRRWHTIHSKSNSHTHTGMRRQHGDNYPNWRVVRCRGSRGRTNAWVSPVAGAAYIATLVPLLPS